MRKAQLAERLATVPGTAGKGGSERVKRVRKQAREESALLSSGQLCSPALVHAAPVKDPQYMFARPTYPYIPEMSAATASSLILQAAPRPRILDAQGHDVDPLRAAASNPSSSAIAGASIAQGASVGGKEALAAAIAANDDSPAISKRPKQQEPYAVSDSKVGLQLAETEAAAIAAGTHDARASGSCSREAAALAQAEAATAGAVELVDLPRGESARVCMLLRLSLRFVARGGPQLRHPMLAVTVAPVFARRSSRSGGPRRLSDICGQHVLPERGDWSE